MLRDYGVRVVYIETANGNDQAKLKYSKLVFDRIPL